MIEDRPYQTDIVVEFRRTTEKFKRIIIVAPTGSGKTIIAAEIIKNYLKQYQPVLVIAHRREIISQTSRKLHDLDIWSGIILAGERETPMATVQVASVRTLWARAMRVGPNGQTRMELPPAALVVVDEAHHATAETWNAILNEYPDAIILGLTATPCRGDGRGLGGIFETMIECPQIAELVELGYLVKSRVYAPSTPDLKGVEVRHGDYVESQLAERMDRPRLVADIVSTWQKFGERRKTVCFATGVGHSLHLRDRFIESGVRAEHIDGSTPKDERDATLARLTSGEIEVVTNCMVLTEGGPSTSCLILARPTRQMGLYRQMVGRVLRPAPGKTDAVILDHSSAVFRHGLPEDRVDWTLDPDKTARSPDHEARKPEMFGGPTLLDCGQCGALREGGKACPHCGFLPVRQPQIIIPREGDLALVQNRKPGKPEIDKQQWYDEFAGYAQERGHKPGFAFHKFKEKFGHKPPWGMNPQPRPPSPEVRSWLRSRAIAWARSHGPR
jgi:superfamily II DNA or RNA helicase